MDSKQKIIYTKNCLEFLDYKCVTPNDKNFRIYEGKNSVIPSMVDANFNDGFLNNWNWIMEIVEAIEKIKEVRDVCITTTGCVIFHKEKPFSSHGVYKKEDVIQAINQFLIWYKQNQK